MGRAATGATGTLRKRNGGSEENDFRTPGNQPFCSVFLVPQLIIPFKSVVSIGKGKTTTTKHLILLCVSSAQRAKIPYL